METKDNPAYSPRHTNSTTPRLGDDVLNPLLSFNDNEIFKIYTKFIELNNTVIAFSLKYIEGFYLGDYFSKASSIERTCAWTYKRVFDLLFPPFPLLLSVLFLLLCSYFIHASFATSRLGHAQTVISRYAFQGWIWVLIASVPDLCILCTLNSNEK